MSLLQELVEELGLSASELLSIIATAPARYKVYNIPKRDGFTFRTIAQPSRELKAIQHYVLHKKLVRYPIHQTAMAYTEGRNILQNAQEHIGANAILKLDFQQFFPSIKVSDWEKFARRNPITEVDLSDLRMYSKIMFWSQQPRSVIARCLSIGAPTSPALSNILLFDLDVSLSEEARRMGIAYTRYADDITVSGPSKESVSKFETIARKRVKSYKAAKFAFNEEKRALYQKGQRRLVTGLVITPERRISIGRERKRLISAMLHRSTTETITEVDKGKLKGLLGFCIANEPTYLDRMRNKYGSRVVDAALKFHVPKRS
jgi:retron-type reverse transcriptase